MFGEAVKRLERLVQHWCKSADSSGKRRRLNTILPSIPHGVLGGHKFKSLGKLLNSWTDWHRIRLGMDIGLIHFAPQYPRGHFVC